jgi:hypothetical protein
LCWAGHAGVVDIRLAHGVVTIDGDNDAGP